MGSKWCMKMPIRADKWYVVVSGTMFVQWFYWLKLTKRCPCLSCFPGFLAILGIIFCKIQVVVIHHLIDFFQTWQNERYLWDMENYKFWVNPSSPRRGSRPNFEWVPSRIQKFRIAAKRRTEIFVLLGGSGGMLPRKILKIKLLRLLEIAFPTNILKITFFPSSHKLPGSNYLIILRIIARTYGPHSVNYIVVFSLHDSL